MLSVLLFLWAISGAFLALLGHLGQPRCEENTGSRVGREGFVLGPCRAPGVRASFLGALGLPGFP